MSQLARDATILSLSLRVSALFIQHVCKDILRLIGNTPIVRLKGTARGIKANIWVKLEYYNPTGSHKDRIALFMLCRALDEGLVRRGDIVVETSTGNTGISIAYVSMLLGLRAVIVVPRSISSEKKRLIRLFGGEVIEVEVSSDPRRYVEEAKRLAKQIGGYYVGQYENPANVEAHYKTTGPEIWRQLNGKVDVYVMGIGTGGTITGVARYLKEKKNVYVVAVEPEGSIISSLLRGEKNKQYKPHIIEGLTGYDIPKILDHAIIDEFITVNEREAVKTCYKLLRLDGIFAGPSTGAHVYAALQVAKRLGKANIVTIAADTGFRYLSTIYNDEWVKKKFGKEFLEKIGMS